MIDIAHWQAPQWILVIIITLSMILNLVRSGKPKNRYVNAAGQEVHDNGGALIAWGFLMSMLAWGGFLA